jgi:hypothetical protein
MFGLAGPLRRGEHLGKTGRTTTKARSQRVVAGQAPADRARTAERGGRAGRILALQATAGNRAVTAMLQRDVKPGGGGGDRPCPRYGPGEVEKSRQDKGFLPQPVLPQAGPKILVADFGVDWRHVKQSVIDHPVLLRFLTEEAADPGVRFEVVGYSDCAGAEFNNTFLRTGRARRVSEMIGTRAKGRPVSPSAGALKTYVVENDDQVGRAVNRGVIVEAKHPTAPVTPSGPVPFVAPESVAEMQEMLDDAENLLVDPSFLRPRDRQRLYGTTAVAPGWKPDPSGSLKRIDAVLQFVKPLVDGANVASHANDSLKSTILGQYYTSGYLETAVLSYREVRLARDALPADAKGSVVSELAVEAKSLFAFRSAAKLKILADEGVSFELESGSSPRPAPEFRSSMRAQLPGGAGLDKRELRVLAWLRDNKDTILAAETSFRVDRRAIGAVISWEAMKNVMRGGLRGWGRGRCTPTAASGQACSPSCRRARPCRSRWRRPAWSPRPRATTTGSRR